VQLAGGRGREGLEGACGRAACERRRICSYRGRSRADRGRRAGGASERERASGAPEPKDAALYPPKVTSASTTTDVPPGKEAGGEEAAEEEGVPRWCLPPNPIERASTSTKAMHPAAIATTLRPEGTFLRVRAPWPIEGGPR